ncbi:unnamed protein product [Rotaria magnacalcarata]|uniref:Tetratricopeptide repeat protein n=1 Tax=Rotaria magnacalcarata TaxID=392030 RepID=A0A820EAH5_9BILA|nr:unnamed protein product [Rotaria magnacalcarata]
MLTVKTQCPITTPTTTNISNGSDHQVLNDPSDEIVPMVATSWQQRQSVNKYRLDIAVTLNNIANILVEADQFDVALGLYIAMATKCVEKQLWQDALELCQQALNIYEDVLPSDSTERESILKTLKNDMNQLLELIKSNT